jgi:hypothetical protein
MDHPNELIETASPDGRKGIKIQKHLYCKIVELIVTALSKIDEISLADVLTLTKEACASHPNIGFVSLQVKLDLEAKRYLKVIRTRYTHQQIISLSRKGKAHFKVQGSGREGNYRSQ